MTNEPNFFYAEQGLHLYKVFITHGRLWAARVAGDQYDEKSVRARFMRGMRSGGLLGAILRPRLLKRQIAKAVKLRTEAEALYDNQTLGSAEFLAIHKANFTWTSGQVVRVVVKPAPISLERLFVHLLSVEFVMGSGKKQTFLLPMNQNPEFVVQVIKPFLSAVQYERSPSAR